MCGNGQVNPYELRGEVVVEPDDVIQCDLGSGWLLFCLLLCFCVDHLDIARLRILWLLFAFFYFCCFGLDRKDLGLVE